MINIKQYEIYQTTSWFWGSRKGEILPHCSCKARYYLTRFGLIACPCLWRRISAFFFISNRNRSYEPSVWVRATNDNAGNKRKTYAHCDHTIKELPTNFLFWYDTGDDWTFICKKYQKEVERKNNSPWRSGEWNLGG